MKFNAFNSPAYRRFLLGWNKLMLHNNDTFLFENGISVICVLIINIFSDIFIIFNYYLVSDVTTRIKILHSPENRTMFIH